MSVGEEEVVRLHEPPVVREVRLIHARLRERPVLWERLREHVRALALVVRGLDEARDERWVADRSAILVEADLVAPANRKVSDLAPLLRTGCGRAERGCIHNPVPGTAGVVDRGVSPVRGRGVVCA